MKMMHGACCLAFWNMSRTREAPTPTNISTKSEPEMVKNGTLASPAMARASRVLPVPGGPTISTPCGTRPPSCWNLRGSRRNSTISPTSSFASSQPATSAKLTLLVFSSSMRALDLPTDIMPPMPPLPCDFFMKKIQTPISSSIGNQEMNTWDRKDGRAGALMSNLTSLSRRSPIRPRSSEVVLAVRTVPLFVSAMIFSPSMVASLIFLDWICASISE